MLTLTQYLNQLFKSSRLQESYSANMMGILDGRPVLLTLPVMLDTYVKHREGIIERRAQFDLAKAQARAHILEGLVKAQDRIDDVIAAGKASSSRDQFESVLRGTEIMPGIDVFSFTEAQAKAIAERRLYQLSRLDVEKVQNEYAELQIKIADLQDIIDSRSRRLSISRRNWMKWLSATAMNAVRTLTQCHFPWTAKTSLRSEPSSLPSALRITFATHLLKCSELKTEVGKGSKALRQRTRTPLNSS